MGVLTHDIAPSAARLTGSLRDIGYGFTTAVADLVDNSVTAEASRINIEAEFVPNGSYVLISDDGRGMTEVELVEALRFGTRRAYGRNELGRFGLGLKTGSFSQCRKLTVVTRRTPKQARISVMTLDLKRVMRTDSWSITLDETSPAIERAKAILMEGPGTVIIWEDLDRALPERYAESGWGRRRLASLSAKTADHLAMVFHRFLEGTVLGRPDMVITVNGEKVEPWNPFAPHEREGRALEDQVFEIQSGANSFDVRFQGFVLPSRDAFSSPEEFERMSGPLKWNRQQGLYIYRANRLVQHGGWSGVRGIDEHTKFARASVDFDTDLDEAFQINVAKMRVVLPPTLKQMLERPIHALCVQADDAYRRAANSGERKPVPQASSGADATLSEVGIALRAAMLEGRSLRAFRETLQVFKDRNPELAQSLGM